MADRFGAGAPAPKEAEPPGEEVITPPADGGDETTGPVDPNNPSGAPGRRSGGSRSSAPSIGQKYDANTKLNIPTKDPAKALKDRQALSTELNPEVDPATIERVNKYDKQPLVDNLNQQIEAARQQYNTQIDRSMDTASRDLNRALADAQGQFQTQQNQVSAAEMNALDNAALYAEARGDKGGIGQAQYNSIQNNAAQNRLAVSQAQTKLATDTARQINDLRAQGEFERADKMLALTQQYLSELRQIEEYAANYNLNVDQINTAIQEWEYNFNEDARRWRIQNELNITQLTGAFSNGMPTYQAAQATLANTAQIAMGLLENGVKPTQLSPTQLGALAEYYGMDQKAINNYFKRVN